MSDLWDQAANELGRPQPTSAAPQQDADAGWRKLHYAMEAAVLFAVKEFEHFWQGKEGASARRMLGNDRIVLGIEPHPKSPVIAYVDGNGSTGLHTETTVAGRPPQIEELDLRVAVQFFANCGPGRNNPDQVRAIVPWLRNKLNEYAAAAKAQRT